MIRTSKHPCLLVIKKEQNPKQKEFRGFGAQFCVGIFSYIWVDSFSLGYFGILNLKIFPVFCVIVVHTRFPIVCVTIIWWLPCHLSSYVGCCLCWLLPYCSVLVTALLLCVGYCLAANTKISAWYVCVPMCLPTMYIFLRICAHETTRTSKWPPPSIDLMYLCIDMSVYLCFVQNSACIWGGYD